MLRSRARVAFVLSSLAGGAALVACADHGSSKSTSSDVAAPSLAGNLLTPFSRPTWAKASNLVGMVNGNEPMTVHVYMNLHDAPNAEAALQAISDPSNPNYGSFLTDDEFNAKYAPTEADVAAVRAHLTSHGLVVDHVPDNRTYVAVTGTASQISSAFSTSLGMYSVAGATRRAPVTTPSLPGNVRPLVLSMLGLSTSPAMRPHRVARADVSRPAAGRNATPTAPPPCSEWFGSLPDTADPPLGAGWPALSYVQCGYRPSQIREAYGFTASVRKGNDGTGISVAIVDAYHSPTLLEDAQTYAANNDPDYPLAASQFTAFDGPGKPTPVDTGWYGEQTLDVEAVHTMAPGAKIVYVGAQSPSDTDLTAAINLILSKRLASIISNSYGSVEAQANDFVIWHALATQAGLKGVGLYFSSGDNGDESQTVGAPSPDFPASLPNVVAVGGTSLALGRTGQAVFETGWETGAASFGPLPPPDGGAADGAVADGGDDGGGADGGDGAPPPEAWQPPLPGGFVFGSGGGTSNVYEQPKWQRNIVPAALANIPGTPARVVPDVAMTGDPLTGLIVGQTDPTSGVYSEQAIGGTSLACPLFSATMALAQQNRGRAFGFSAPLLYARRAGLRDITPLTQNVAVGFGNGVAATFQFPGLAIQTLVGYDDQTGLGVPNGETFLKSVR